MTLSLSPNRADTNESLLQTAVIDVGTSAIELKVGTTRNPARQAIIIYNDSTRTVYLGPSTVTVSGANKGLPLLKGQSATISLGDIGIFAICDTGTANPVIVMELG